MKPTKKKKKKRQLSIPLKQPAMGPVTKSSHLLHTDDKRVHATRIFGTLPKPLKVKKTYFLGYGKFNNYC